MSNVTSLPLLASSDKIDLNGLCVKEGRDDFFARTKVTKETKEKCNEKKGVRDEKEKVGENFWVEKKQKKEEKEKGQTRENGESVTGWDVVFWAVKNDKKV